MENIKEHSINLKRKIEETSNVSEPETFDTWTIITDPLNNTNKQELKEYNSRDRIEIVSDNVDGIVLKYDQDSIDELSDGISIISDSESAGRYSPMPLYTSEYKNYENINKEFENETKEFLYEPIPSNSTSDIENFAQNKNVDIGDTDVKKYSPEFSYITTNIQSTKISASSSLFTTRNISSFFYLGAAIAIVAFVSKMKYSELQNTLQEEIIKQRVDDLELQNNLLRAEMDILSKQVKYLNKDSQSHTISYKSDLPNIHNDNKNNVEKEKIKVWAGKGRIEPTKIIKEKLKMPYSCEQSDKYLDGECMDSENNNGENKDEKSKQSYNLIIDNIKVGLKETIEKIIPVVMQDNILNNFKNIGKITTPEIKKDDHKLNERNAEINNKEKYKTNAKYDNDKIKNINGKMPDINFHNKSDKRNKKENYKLKIIQENHHNRGPQDQEENTEYAKNNKKIDSTVRSKYDSSQYNDNDNENYKYKELGQDFENYSKTKYNKNIKKKKLLDKFDNNNKENKQDRQNDDWHENMMKNREEYRKRLHETWKSDNWLMDRASGREEARMFEKDQNKFRKMRQH